MMANTRYDIIEAHWRSATVASEDGVNGQPIEHILETRGSGTGHGALLGLIFGGPIIGPQRGRIRDFHDAAIDRESSKLTVSGVVPVRIIALNQHVVEAGQRLGPDVLSRLRELEHGLQCA